MKLSDFSKRDVISAILLTAMVSPSAVLSGEKADRPLKASLVTQEQVGYTPGCPSKFGGTITGTGKSTHLGKVSLTAADCITPMENHFTFKGTFTLMAANGDELTGDYSGSFIPKDAAPMYDLSDAKFRITGGTGRFARASGSAELHGNQNIQTGKGKLEVDGTISY